MLPQDQFVSLRNRDWTELEGHLGPATVFSKADGASISRTAALYRNLCNDLTRAEASRYTPDLMAYLNGLAGRAHNVLYGASELRASNLHQLIATEFPREVRKNWRFFALSSALFLIPWAIGLFGALHSQAFAEEVLPASALAQMADSYSQGFDSGRATGDDAQMAGFYVYNNVGIAFRCFATGALLGLGSLFFLVYNGLVIGTTTGFVMSVGYGANIWTFMCGHGPYEITAILISGAAGLQMGYSLVSTKGRTRLGSLMHQGRSILAQISGAAVFLVIAAAIEGFWSPSSLPAPIKWAFSAINMTLVVVWLVFVGRPRAHGERS